MKRVRQVIANSVKVFRYDAESDPAAKVHQSGNGRMRRFRCCRLRKAVPRFAFQ